MPTLTPHAGPSRGRHSALGLVLAALAGCTSSRGAEPAVESAEIALTVGARALSMSVNEALALETSVATNSPARLYTLKYDSTNPGVATASASGVITALAAGSAKINVTARLLDTGGTASAAVSVDVGGGLASLPSPQPI